MQKNGFSYIRRWLWFCLAFVTIFSAATFLLVYQEISNTLGSRALVTTDSSSQPDDSSENLSLTGLKLRIVQIMMAGMAFILIAAIAWMRLMNRRLGKPLFSIARALSRLAAGKLNETVDIENAGDFGQIGSNINELAANLQELLLYIWKQTGDCKVLVKEIHSRALKTGMDTMGADHLAAVEKLSVALDNLREMAQSYAFYDVRLDGEQAVAIKEPGQDPPSAEK